MKRAPLSEGEDSRKNWKRINEIDADLTSITPAAEVGSRRTIGGEGMFPFRLYRLPRRFRSSLGADDWRKFRVRAGRVLESDATGTDAGDDDPDNGYYPLTATDVLVAASVEKFWFWLEIGEDEEGATTAVVRYGVDPTLDEYDGGEEAGQAWGPTTKPWTSFPKPDAGHIPIGWVDTLTQVADKVAIVRQLLRTDVVGSAAESSEIGTEAVFVFTGNFKDHITGRRVTRCMPQDTIDQYADWVASDPYEAGDIARYEEDGVSHLYICLVDVTSEETPLEDTTNWEQYDNVVSSTDTVIAKQPHMWETDEELLRGLTVTYTVPYDYANQRRYATDNADPPNEYWQYIVPPYSTVGRTKHVKAVRVATTGVFVTGTTTEAEWSECTARAWAKEFTPPA